MHTYHVSLSEPDNIIEISHIKFVIYCISFESDDKFLRSSRCYIGTFGYLKTFIHVLIMAVKAVYVIVLELLPAETLDRVYEDMTIESENRSH